jgi:acetolactate synthase-1/2/3 large subunit|tara:strand:+ start:211 stop:1899 length:1689 start_codon:yes stop_codon:yes gene_type:complete
MMIKTGGQIVCDALIREGVDVVFGLPGGAILPLYATLGSYPELRHVLVRHEEGASLAADGYARASGRVGVCMATSGPGATNLITGLATAMMDSVAVVAITGQVGRGAIGSDAFQETDITGATLPVTKHNYLVMDTADLAATIKEAFYIARSGRPGPVLIDIPRDVQAGEIEFDEAEWDKPVSLRGYNPPTTAEESEVAAAAALINEAERPVILAGHGVIISRAYKELRELAENAQIPVITTMLGISAFPEDHVLSTGFPGMHGMAYSSLALDQADLIVNIGGRFDDRITGDTKRFAPNAKKIHIDIDPAELGKNVKVEAPVMGDVKHVLNQLNPQVNKTTHTKWIQHVEQLKADHPSLKIRETEELLGQHVVKAISDATKGDALIVSGVGQHQMWAAQHYQFKNANSWFSSGGAGTMGYEVPAAMGAQLAHPDKEVWTFAGDGGIQMTLSEFATIAENNLPVKIAILNNNMLGMITQWQDMVFDKNFYANTYTGNPDFVKLADAYGIKALRVTNQDEMEGAINAARAHDGPFIIDFVIYRDENVFPMIPSGQSVAQLIEENL